MVTAPYEVDGQIVGTVGVIGPTRMAYERVIPDRRYHREAAVQRAVASLKIKAVLGRSAAPPAPPRSFARPFRMPR